jgi:hypothetical protein
MLQKMPCKFNCLLAVSVTLATTFATLGAATELTLIDNDGQTATCTYTDISIDPQDGSATVNVTDLENEACGGSTTATAPEPTITVAPFSVEQGDSVSITYSTDSAESCTPSGNFPPWNDTTLQLGTDIQAQFPTASVTPQSYTVQIDCSNAAGSNSNSASFQVTDSGGGGTTCAADRQPPAGMTRATSCLIFEPDVDCTSYSAVFGGVPGTTGIRQFSLSRNQYASMALSLPDGVPANAEVAINARELQGGNADIEAGNLIWSISTCPGDFNVDAISQELDSACVKTGFLAQNGFAFGGSAFADDSDICALPGEPGKVFYLNILYTLDDPNTTPSTQLEWSCGNTDDRECGHQLQVTNPLNW